MPERISPWGIYDIFTVQGGAQIFWAVVGDTQWRVFCEAFGFTDLYTDTRLATNNDRVRARAWLLPTLRERLAGQSREALAVVFEREGLPFAPITDPQHLFDDPHLLQTGGLAPMTLPDGRATKVPLLPLMLDGERLGLRRDPPRLGQHGREVLLELGYTEADIAAMVQAGVLALPE